MLNFFYRGQFDNYKVSDLRKSQESIRESYTQDSYFSQRKKRVFLSHKHDDLEDLKVTVKRYPPKIKKESKIK